MQRRPASGLLPGLWEFPGGKIETGERPDSAARRELGEETGLAVKTLAPLGTVHHAYSHFTVELHVFAGAPREVSTLKRTSVRRWVTPSEFGRLPRPKATEKVVALLLDAKGGRASQGSGSRPGRTPASWPTVAPPRSRRPPR
ncbi:MAG: NUDIX domain-containing protein [Candidatus Lutacidiplasmatales archaeon]